MYITYVYKYIYSNIGFKSLSPPSWNIFYLKDFLKNIRSWVDNECRCLRTVDISNADYIHFFSFYNYFPFQIALFMRTLYNHIKKMGAGSTLTNSTHP